MDNFLKENQHGGSFDSEGQFVLSWERGLEELSKHTVVRPEQWVLKMVQAAVAGGAQRLDMKQSRREMLLSFSLEQVPTPADLQNALFNPQLPVTPFLHELVIGLRVLLTRRKLTIRWPASAEVSSLHWNGQVMETGQENARGSALEVSAAYSGGWFEIPREQAAESHILQAQAAYCPIPLWLDGREITVLDLPLDSSHTDHHEGSPHHFASGYFHEPMGSGEVTKPTRFRNPLLYRDPLVRFERGSEPALGSFSLFSSCTNFRGRVDEPFRLLWTRHGVVCGVHEIPYADLGGFLQLPGEHLRSDLSGLSLQVEDDEVRKVKKKLLMLSQPGHLAIDLLQGFEPLITVGDAARATAQVVGYISLGIFAVAGGVDISGLPSSAKSTELNLAVGSSDRLRKNLAALLQIAEWQDDENQTVTC